MLRISCERLRPSSAITLVLPAARLRSFPKQAGPLSQTSGPKSLTYRRFLSPPSPTPPLASQLDLEDAMGLLVVGTPLDWDASEPYRRKVKYDGITQFLALYDRLKDRKADVLYWGDEVWPASRA